MGLTKKQKTILHVAKSKLGLDDATYRDALQAYAGVRSSNDLDYDGFLQVMKHFDRCGFKSGYSRGGFKTRTKRAPGMATDAQVRKIKATWLSLDNYYEPGTEWKALRGFLKKRFRVEHENFLTFVRASDVIEALKAIASR